MRTLVLATPHMTGDDVRHAQELLKAAGYYAGDLDGDFGPLSAQASYRAQYWLGYATPRQAFGTALEKLLGGAAQPSAAQQARIDARRAQAADTPLREKALAVMEALVGRCELPAGSNHVPDVTDWWGNGDMPWCCITVSKAYVAAGSKAFARGSRYQYVPTLVGDARAGRNGLAVTTDPKPGDLVCFDWDGSNFAGGSNHVGMFRSGTAAAFETIEGNVDSRCDVQRRTGTSAPRIVFVHVAQ